MDHLIAKVINKINSDLGYVEPFYAKNGAFTYEKNISGYQLQKYVGNSGAISTMSDCIGNKRTFYQMVSMFHAGMEEMQVSLITSL